MRSDVRSVVLATGRCPAHLSQLTEDEDGGIRCSTGHLLETRDGILSLLPEGFGAAPPPPGRPARPPRLPPITHNLVGDTALVELLERVREDAVVLVIGAGAGGHVRSLARRDVTVIDSDVVPHPRLDLMVDGAAIPFADETFNLVVAEAVLEHVLDPVAVASEVHRVLRTDGLVYASTPFMQQVHEGAHDITRWTHVGHRRLFRMFDEVGSGISVGPGSALAWSVKFFLLSFPRGRSGRRVAAGVAHITCAWLGRLDAWLATRPGAYDAAGGFWFAGSKRSSPVSDAEVLNGYRGAG